MALSLGGSSLRLVVVFLLAFVFSPSFARPLSAHNVQRSIPLPPSQDPFYQPPAGFESHPPGSILREREVAVAFLGLILDPVKAYQLLYRTTAIDGSAIAAVTTVFVPLLAKKDRFISLHTAYDSSATICNPSYNYRLAAAQTDLISSAEQLIIQTYLALGNIVSSPDYEGPDAAFSPGHLEGMGVLDSMRAVSNFKSLGLTAANPMIVGTGYSGGAIATGWAASLQPTYAPELNIKGWAQGGTPANLTGTLLFLDDTLFSGFLPAAVAGLSMPSAYGAELKPVIDRIVTPTGAQALASARQNCAPVDLLTFPEMSILSTKFQSLGRGLLYEPTIQKVLSQNTLGVNKTETPTAPVFVYHATQDEIIPYSNASALVSSWCENGVSVKFTTFATGGHLTTEIVALPRTISFIENAFRGQAPTSCSSETVLSSILDPIALGIELEPVLLKLVEVILRLGSNDSNLKKDPSILTKPITW
ncbi:Lipase [Penicillium ucsense]|uniref:Lipase n=1 Tax=Penicillium ucsense TaxID=2839758 RepID=A0A8J8WBA6_9EURO|nr:Lipase [Penicillium ucsense]KAF7734663.1 Lipase [Penicillium ucsense]